VKPLQAFLQFFYVLFKVWFLLYFVITLILLYPFFYVLLLKPSWFKYAFVLKKIWAHLLCLGAFTPYTVTHNFKPEKNKKYIFCANHSSYFDIILSYCIIPNYFIFMGKKELEKVPLFNIFFKEMNILVDRKSSTGSHKAFIRAGVELNKHNSIILFPEGTISKEAPLLKPFKNGAFRLAIDTQTYIVPITFLNTRNILQDKAFLQGKAMPQLAKIIIDKPIEISPQSNIEELKIQLRNTIAKNLSHYNQITIN
jgi:1-acyl-sn-glycerol-3-phosphate acyltransferase